MRARLYICYGMPKSGSTLAFQLSQAVAAAGGQRPDLQGELTDMAGHKTAEVGEWSEPMLAHLLRLAEDRKRMLVVKTQAAPGAVLHAAMQDGLVKAQAVCRDPRDIALSLVDMGRKGASLASKDRTQILRGPEDARADIAGQVAVFHEWAALPDVLALNYERVTFDLKGAVARIAAHMGVRCWPWWVARSVERGKARESRSKPLRHHSEMAAASAADWQGEFGEFIATYCSDIPAGCLEQPRRRA